MHNQNYDAACKYELDPLSVVFNAPLMNVIVVSSYCTKIVLECAYVLGRGGAHFYKIDIVYAKLGIRCGSFHSWLVQFHLLGWPFTTAIILLQSKALEPLLESCKSSIQNLPCIRCLTTRQLLSNGILSSTDTSNRRMRVFEQHTLNRKAGNGQLVPYSRFSRQ